MQNGQAQMDSGGENEVKGFKVKRIRLRCHVFRCAPYTMIAAAPHITFFDEEHQQEAQLRVIILSLGGFFR